MIIPVMVVMMMMMVMVIMVMMMIMITMMCRSHEVQKTRGEGRCEGSEESTGRA